jgi:hypothetical protein
VGANGTPTFYINGHELVGAQDASAFETIIDDEIKKADELLKKGTPLKDVYDKLMTRRPPGAARAGRGAAPRPRASRTSSSATRPSRVRRAR